MTRHSSLGSDQQAVPDIYNFPIPERILQTLHFYPMTPQYSNQSFASTSSGSYDSNQDGYMSTSPTQYDNYDERQSTHTYARHNSKVAGYGKDMCISPRVLHPQNHFEARRSCDNQRVVPSSDHRHIAEYEASHNRMASQRSERRHRDDDNSSTEKDNSGRVPCVSEGCTATFSRKADVNRHFTSTHKVVLIDCDVNNCGRKGENGFARKDHLLEHKRGYHCMDLPKRPIKNSKGRHQS